MYKKFFIEIRSKKGSWKIVELLEFRPGNKMLIKLPSGQIILRKRIRVRYGITKRMDMFHGNHVVKNYPNKKRRRRRRKNTNRLKKRESS